MQNAIANEWTGYDAPRQVAARQRITRAQLEELRQRRTRLTTTAFAAVVIPAAIAIGAILGVAS